MMDTKFTLGDRVVITLSDDTICGLYGGLFENDTCLPHGGEEGIIMQNGLTNQSEVMFDRVIGPKTGRRSSERSFFLRNDGLKLVAQAGEDPA